MIVLASRSPRRRELLSRVGIKEFLIKEADIDERAVKAGSPDELVRALALKKARWVAAHRPPEDVVIGADTVVCLDGEVIGKPRDEANAREMLLKLSGRKHEVFTGVAVIKNGSEIVCCERTEVCFRKMSEREIERYVSLDKPLDKAGAYGIQDRGALFVEGINGDFYNVMGLPLCVLGRMLAEAGVELF